MKIAAGNPPMYFSDFQAQDKHGHYFPNASESRVANWLRVLFDGERIDPGSLEKEMPDHSYCVRRVDVHCAEARLADQLKLV